MGSTPQLDAGFYTKVSINNARELEPQAYARRDEMPHVIRFLGMCGLYGDLLRCGFFSLLRLLNAGFTQIPFDTLDTPGRSRATTLVVESLQLMGLGELPMPFAMAVEGRLVSAIQACMQRNLLAHDDDNRERLYTAYLAVAPLLAERGINHRQQEQMHTSETERLQKRLEELSLRGGLQPCALPSCGRREESAGQLKACSACRSVRYCCVDHSKENWAAHKADCKRIVKGLQASGGGAAGKEDSGPSSFAGRTAKATKKTKAAAAESKKK